MKRTTSLVLLIMFTFLAKMSQAQELYFPPLNGSWETIDPSELGWCTEKIDSLYDFLEDKNTKGFLVLKDGKIVLEKYFGTFTVDSNWYWASAGKTLTAFLVGKAQEEGHLNIDDKTSDHLGLGWSNCTQAQEDKITVLHQLSMTTGLDDGVDDVDCTLDTCLNYLADPGTRWAYHNAPYTLLENVVENATSTNYNLYTTQVLKNTIGMNGLWIRLGYNNVYFSTVRSMARYGLLMQNKAVWGTDTILHDTDYVNAMINTSQEINRSYGYLWWLNGKSSHMLPRLQFEFQGPIAEAAPADMYAGLGKNGQVVGVSPSTGLVVIRMGNAPDNSGLVPISFYNDIWVHLNKVICTLSTDDKLKPKISVCPNPLGNDRVLKLNNLPLDTKHIQIVNDLGATVHSYEAKGQVSALSLDLDHLPAGSYYLRLTSDTVVICEPLILID